MPKHNYESMVGQSFGSWTVLSVHTNKRRLKFFELRCVCGRVDSRQAHSVVSGRSTRCRTCNARDISTRPRKYNHNKYEDYGVLGVGSIYSGYASSAEKRGISFDLTFEEFTSIIFKRCHYCGIEPKNLYKSSRVNGTLYSGIDRVDNTIGYQLDNCVPCCKVCNYAKRDMSADEFLEWINRVYSHQTYGTDLRH